MPQLTRPELERRSLLKEALREELNAPEHKDELREIFKQALREWLNEHWAVFGRWTFRGISLMAFSGIVYLWARAKGLL